MSVACDLTTLIGGKIEQGGDTWHWKMESNAILPCWHLIRPYASSVDQSHL